MSGIGGIFFRDGRQVEKSDCIGLEKALSPRGPDTNANLVDGPVALLHCRLFDTRESMFEKLPYRCEDSRTAITFDGRLDNREELYDRIGWCRPLREISDSHLVLSAYRKWHADCNKYLLGDFAYAIWDQQKKELFCARDHMGVRPFYYYLNKGCFAFSSTAKSLLAVPFIKKTLNSDRVADFLCCAVTDKESTFFLDIARLPPSHAFQVGLSKKKIYRYFQFEAEPLQLKTSRQYEEQFHDIFIESLKCRLRSAYPVGSYLSGGLDSSSIVSTISGCESVGDFEGIQTFSGIFKKFPSCDERKYFQRVIDRYHLQSNTLAADNLHPGKAVEKIVTTADEPPFSPHFFMKWHLSCMARERGIRVMLDGHDGDSAVSYGFGFLSELAIQGNIAGLVGQFRAYDPSFTWLDLLKRIVRQYQLCGQEYLPPFFGMLPERRSLLETIEILSDDVTKTSDIKGRLHQMCCYQSNRGQTEKMAHLLSINHPTQGYMLEFLDTLGSCHSLAMRFPFFDKRLISFCLSLPGEEKFKEGLNRSIVRRGLSKYLPAAIRERKTKTDFSLNLIHAYEKRADKWFVNALANLGETTCSFINREVFSKQYETFLEKHSSNKLKSLYSLIKIVSLDKWLKSNSFK